MSIWITLGIDETKDKELIKKAYRTKLTTVNPEDDPDGFMRLREAFEEANRLADKEEDASDEPQEKLSGVELLIDEIYMDFSRRIDVESWQELFQDDYFTSLEQSSDSFERLLVYLLDHYRLPSKVFRLIDEMFDIEERRQELTRKFPDNFIDYLINNAKYEDFLNYYLFEGDLSFADEFIDAYYEARNGVLKHEFDEAIAYLDKLANMPVSHPYTEVLRMQMDMIRTTDSYEDGLVVFNESDAERAKQYNERCGELLEQYPDDFIILELQGNLELYTGNYDAAEEIFERIRQKENMNQDAIERLAIIAFRQKKYEKSRDLYLEVIQKNPYDGRARAGMYQANLAYIEEGKAWLVDHPDDRERMQEMAWSCYQNYMYEEGIEILDAFEPAFEESFKYYNVKGRMYIEGKRYEEALDCFVKWKQSVEQLMEQESPSEEDGKKIKRYPYIKSLMGDCYLNLGRHEEALEILQDALLSNYDEKAYTYEILGELLIQMGRFDDCIRYCDEALNIQPENHMFYLRKAKACFERQYLREAMIACDSALHIFPYEIEAYVYKIKIYQWVEQYEDAVAVIQQYREFMPNSDTMKYYEALNYKYQNEEEKAQRILEDLREHYNADESDLTDYSEALCELAEIYGDSEDYNVRKQGIDLYYQVLERNPNHRYAHGSLGYLHRMNFEYQSSINECTKQAEIYSYPNLYINRAMSYKRIHKYDEAIADFEYAINMDPNRLFCYKQLGEIYYHKKDFNQAIAWYDQGLEHVNEEDEYGVEHKLEIIRWKARAMACLNMYQESVDLLQEVLDTYENSRDSQVRYELALTYTRLDRFDLSRKVLEEYIENGEDEDDRFWYLSLLMELTGEEGCLDESRQLYKKAIEMRPKAKRIHGLMGRIYAMNKCFEEAKNAFFQAIDEDGPNAEDYYCEYLEMVSLCNGKLPEGYSELVEKAKSQTKSQLDPKHYIKLARLYRALSDYDSALEWIRKAITSEACQGCGYAACEEGYYELGITYQRMGNLPKAIEAFEEAIRVHGHCGIYDEKLLECRQAK